MSVASCAGEVYAHGFQKQIQRGNDQGEVRRTTDKDIFAMTSVLSAMRDVLSEQA